MRGGDCTGDRSEDDRPAEASDDEVCEKPRHALKNDSNHSKYAAADYRGRRLSVLPDTPEHHMTMIESSAASRSRSRSSPTPTTVHRLICPNFLDCQQCLSAVGHRFASSTRAASLHRTLCQAHHADNLPPMCAFIGHPEGTVCHCQTRASQPSTTATTFLNALPR